MANHFVKRLKKIRRSQSFNEIYTNIFSRHFSFVLTTFLSYTSISPNQVTIWMFASGIAGSALIFTGDIHNLAYGSLFFVLLNILDASDGELARFKGMVTKGGDYLDRLAHYFTNSLFILSLSFFLYRIFDDLIPILLFGFFIELIYTLDEISRDLIITCDLEAEKEQRKSLKSKTKIQIPNFLEIFLLISGTNLALFHLTFVLSLCEIYLLNTFNNYNSPLILISYFLYFGFITLIKFTLRISKINKTYFS